MSEYRCPTCGKPVPGPGEEHGRCFSKRWNEADRRREASEIVTDALFSTLERVADLPKKDRDRFKKFLDSL